ncbi:TetR/AcrR family transcriptional regulator [Zavarzinia sp.]|uniref:TetR/AcrR family transcriptional regulator n=1 Tax=Zavarzinia sp. TaxID=2027920 RepID=UPI003BB6983F
MTTARGPSRPRQRRSDITRDRVANVALDLFNAHGYTPVTTNAIAEACGISTGSLYYHFRHREDVLWYLFQRVEARVRPLFVEPPFAETGLALMRRQLAAIADLLCEYRFFFPDQTAILRRDERVAEAFTRLQADVVEAIARQLGDFLRPALQGGRRVAPDTAELARAIWLMVTSWITYLVSRGEMVDAQAIARVVPVVVAILDPFIPA